MNSRKETKKILVALEDKRDYVLSNETIADSMIRKTVKYNDFILSSIEEIYDCIIKNKGIARKEIRPILYKIKSIIGSESSKLVLNRPNIESKQSNIYFSQRQDGARGWLK